MCVLGECGGGQIKQREGWIRWVVYILLHPLAVVEVKYHMICFVFAGTGSDDCSSNRWIEKFWLYDSQR